VRVEAFMKRVVVVTLAVLCACAAFAQDAPPTFTLEHNALVLPEPVAFTGDVPDAKGKALVHVAAYLADKSYISLMRVEGHVVGKDAQARSEARALAVAKALVKAGVDCKRVLPVGFGASKPAFEDASKNTRMVFENAALRGHAIGGMPVDGGGKVAGDPCAP
jgi:OOP family OmpA-OmpF porin